MLAQASITVLSPLSWLLSNSGFIVLAFGLVLTVWAVWILIKPQRLDVHLLQLLLSTIPGVIAAIAIYLAAVDFGKLAATETAPKPVEIAAAVGRGMSYGFVGLLSTVVPVLLGVLALRKSWARMNTDQHPRNGSSQR